MQLVKTQNVEVLIKFRGKQIPKTETKYTYKTNDGALLTFMASPKKSWSWDLFDDESNEQGIKNSKSIIEFHIDSLMN